VVVTRKITERVTQETNARAGHLFDDIKAYKTETEDSLKQLGQDYTRHKEQMNSEQANWQDKAGGELDKVKDNVKSVEDRVTEIEAAAQNSIQKLNAEITYLRGQIATRQVTDSVMPSQALPVAAVDVQISSQSDLEVAAGAGNYHMGNCNVNNCSRTVGGNATAQQNAIVNVKSDVFANNSPMNELTLPTFHDSLNQMAIHFLRDLDEYYRIKNVPEPLKLPLAMRAVTDPTTKSWFSTVYGELHDYEHFLRFLQNFYGIHPLNPGSDAQSIRTNLPCKMANP
jgi:gas vesicle protein